MSQESDRKIAERKANKARAAIDYTVETRAAEVLKKTLGYTRGEADALVKVLEPTEREAIGAVFADLDKPDQAGRVHQVLNERIDRKLKEELAAKAATEHVPLVGTGEP